MNLSIAYSQALLSDSAYASLQIGLPADNAQALMTRITGRRLEYLTEEDIAAGSAVLQSWQPVATLDDPSGAQATIFKNTSTGAFTVAVRGTDGSALDYIQDFVIALGVPPPGAKQYIALTSWLDQLLAPGALLDGVQINFTGHSLGGYLAAAVHDHYRTELPGLVGTAYLFNAPSTGGVLGTAAQFIKNFFGVPAPTGADIVNIQSSEGLSLTASLGFEPAEITFVQTPESTNPLDWHAISHLRNALLVASTFENATRLRLADFNKLVDSFPGGLPGAMGYLEQVATGSSSVTATWTSLSQAAAAVLANTTNLTGCSLASSGWAQVALHDTNEGAAVRTALEALSPIAIIRQNAAASELNDRTPLYWHKRTEMLQRLAWFNENEIAPYTTQNPVAPDGGLLPEHQADGAQFVDGRTGIAVMQGGPYNNTVRTLFGASDSSSQLSGGGVADFLFGSSRSETLRGEYGADYLEGYGGGDQLIGDQGDDVLVALTAESNVGYQLDGGTENDRITGSRSTDEYLFRKGDGHDTVFTLGGADVLRLLPGSSPETGVQEAEVRFIRAGLNLTVAVGESDSVTIVGWFNGPPDGSRLGAVKLGDKSWAESEITEQALNPSTELFTQGASGSTSGRFVIEHADGSSTVKTIFSSGGWSVEFLSATPPEELPFVYPVSEKYSFGPSGDLYGTATRFSNSAYQDYWSDGNFAHLELSQYTGGWSVTLHPHDEGQGYYDIRPWGRIDSSHEISYQLAIPTSEVSLTAAALRTLPFVLPSSATFVAKTVQGALAIGQQGFNTMLFGDEYHPRLVAPDGSEISAPSADAMPLFVSYRDGQVLSDQIPSSGVILSEQMNPGAYFVHRDAQGNVCVSAQTFWPDATTIVLSSNAPLPLFKTIAGETLDTTAWEHAPYYVESGAGEFVLNLPAEGVTVVLEDGMSLDDPTTVVTQHVRDLHIQFESGTELVLVDWAVRPAALTLQTTGAQAWSAAEVASHIQGYVGDPADNAYTVLTASGQWVLGGEGNDVLWGGAVPGNDLLDGQGGDDRLYGRGGDDVLIGGNGVDFLDGGDGNDELHGSELNDELWGQAGNDRLYGGEGNDKIYGNGGQDLAEGGPGNDLVAGGSEDDVLKGDEGDDDVFGGAGNDELHGGSGVNRLYGESGNDVLYGGADRNVLSGGEGNDVLLAQGLYDELYGGGGVDQYHLQPHEGARRLLFEDAAGGSIDLSAYHDSGIGVTVQKASADQLILTTSSQESLVVNGWGHGTTVLTSGSTTWTTADLAARPSMFQLFGSPYGFSVRTALAPPPAACCASCATAPRRRSECAAGWCGCRNGR